jgi:hypothetical protein
MSEKNEVTTTEDRKGPPTADVSDNGLQIKSLDTMWWLACRIHRSNMVPKDCKTPEDVFIRMQHGMSAGLNPMQSVQYVSNVNGRPCIWGPPLKGLILASGKCKTWKEEIIGSDPTKDDFYIQITIERHDIAGEQVVRFGTKDARRAGLMGRDTYKQYPEDMLLYRCSGRVAKRHFPDVISGLTPAEDARDIIDVEVVDEPEPKAKPTTLEEVARNAKAKQEAKPEPQKAEEVPDENGEVTDDSPSDDDAPWEPEFGEDPPADAKQAAFC